jgi:hypothetical protein
LLLGLLLAACSDGNSNDNRVDNNPYTGYTSELYGSQQNWLCRPDIDDQFDICDRDLSSTIVFADGTAQIEPGPGSADRSVDCFYVYPTVSGDLTDNSDLVPGAEIGVTYIQAARYRSACRLYAPVYRQITLAALNSGKYFDSEVADVAYGDVLDAFKHFVANGEGRGFILVGHSQGSTHLIRLIQEEIETNPYLADRMIAAHLLGWTIALPSGDDLGGTFAATPPCTFDNDTHCFVNYVSYRKTAPPEPGTAVFGITGDPDTRAACTHPVDLGAGLLNLDSNFSIGQLQPYSDPADNAAITTPFVKVPGLLLGECIEEDGKGYLAITVDADPADPRVDDVEDFLPGWGLHLIDMPLAQEDLVRLAEKQAEVWLND